MSVFRVEKSREFTVIANCVFKDRTLSAKAKGLLVEMLSLPENWDYTLKGLTCLFTDGLDSIRQGIRELEEHGYIVRERKRDAKGRLGGMEYVIYETPRVPVENPPVSVGKSSDSVENKVSEPVPDVPICTCPAEESPTTGNPVQAKPAEGTAMLYKEIKNKELRESITHESNPNQSLKETEPAVMDVMGYEEAREIVQENIEYDILCERYPAERLDEIVDIASEALCTRRATFTLGKDTYPYALVKDRLLRLNASHIDYIIGCIDANTTEIHQIKPYLLKTLINAPATMESYYTTKVNHDLYGSSK
ncbi:MAG: helix-turn-helix domain-containing protein [Clostridia bacterium]|nr:helix-turn-helix domain-containing protein [Clostridia bacterium]